MAKGDAPFDLAKAQKSLKTIQAKAAEVPRSDDDARLEPTATPLAILGARLRTHRPATHPLDHHLNCWL